MAYISTNFQTHTLTYNTAFTDSNTINITFGITRVGNTAVSGNNVDDNIAFEVSHWTTGATIGLYDHGIYTGCTGLYISYYWRATGY